MKKVGIGATLGILLTLSAAYVLEDLNAGAIALLTLLCLGVGQAIVWCIAKLARGSEKT